MSTISIDQASSRNILERDRVVRLLLEPILEHFDDGVTEIVINQPGRLLKESAKGWVLFEQKDLTFSFLESLAVAIATANATKIDRENPILSASLPDGERVQIVIPPAVEEGTISYTIRKPGSSIKSLESYAADGFFNDVVWVDAKGDESILQGFERQLLVHLRNRQFVEFFRLAVSTHINQTIVGGTGSGKTTFMKALVALISKYERLISIEDVREIFIPEHKNFVPLIFNPNDGRRTAATLIRSTMRMKPTRLLPAELRGAEAYDLLKILTSGHGGSITTYHADDSVRAIARFVFMAKEHPEAAALDPKMLKDLLFQTIDLIAHVKAEAVLDEEGRQIGNRRFMTEIYFNPWRKREIAYEL